MTEEQRDTMIIEINNDVKWLKEWTIEHKALHSKYSYFIIATIIGLLITLLKTI